MHMHALVYSFTLVYDMTRQPPSTATFSSFISLHIDEKKFPTDGALPSVLKNIHLEIEDNEFVAIVGGSGCGKSTLLRIIAGLDESFSGHICIEGKKVAGVSSDRGMVFQEHRLFPWLRVKENIMLGLEGQSQMPRAEKEHRVREALSMIGLGGYAEAFPHQLSGGMAQRVAIARGIVAKPRILMMDEPFGALDALTRRVMQDELLQIWGHEKNTVILVTHDVEEAIFLADRVIIMDPRPGRIRKVVDVRMDRPRSRSSAEFTRLREDLLFEFTGTYEI